MDTVSDKTLASWTRPKNDEATCEYHHSQNTDMYKFMTFTPEYLKHNSCITGNTQNCITTHAQNIENESRLGKLTNLNEIQRDSTNDRAMGLRTTPNFMSGNLIDPRMIQDMATLESKFQHTTKLNIPSSSLMDQHHFDQQKAQSAPEMLTRESIRVSTRVSRRNAFAKQHCNP